MNWIDQNENDAREIERAIELPPDEPHPRYVKCPECGSDDVHDGAEWDFECLGCAHVWSA